MSEVRRAESRSEAVAVCWTCDEFRVTGVWSEQARKRARRHTRETGHTTEVEFTQTVEYHRVGGGDQ